jgi:hypothetical protein
MNANVVKSQSGSAFFLIFILDKKRLNSYTLYQIITAMSNGWRKLLK